MKMQKSLALTQYQSHCFALFIIKACKKWGYLMSSSSVFVSEIWYSWKFHGGAWNTLCWCVWFRLAIRRWSAFHAAISSMQTQIIIRWWMGPALIWWRGGRRRAFHALIFLFWHRSTRGITMPCNHLETKSRRFTSCGRTATPPQIHTRVSLQFSPCLAFAVGRSVCWCFPAAAHVDLSTLNWAIGQGPSNIVLKALVCLSGVKHLYDYEE